VTGLTGSAVARIGWFVALAFGLLVGTVGCNFSTEESDRKRVDVAVLEALDTPQAIGSVKLLSAELDEPTCSVDCPAPARFWFFGCNSCRSDVEESVASMSEKLIADGWDPIATSTTDEMATFSRQDSTSRTGEVIIQILWATGQGMIRENAEVVANGTESELWVRASTEGFDA